MSEIRWLNSLEEARNESLVSKKLILMFFHHPDCGGCKKSINITFMDPHVQEFIESEFITASFLVTEAQDVTARYKIEWTPTFIMADSTLNELERWVGYLPPQDFISQVRLSEGLAEFHRNRFREAENDFAWILDNSPESEAAPEARYFLGVALYKDTHDPECLTRTWEALNKRYPGNYWTKKASAWSEQ